jgi:putative inorganic carbon (hco3(-)) transporter
MAIRDLVITAIVFGSLPFILRKPHIGIIMWVWVSVMNPHRLTWGFAYLYPFAAIIAAVTLVSVLINGKERRLPPLNSLTLALFMFIAWTGVTSIFAFHPGEAYVKWAELMKTMLMAFLIPVVFHRKEHLRVLIWMTALSVAYYGLKGGVWVLLTGGGNRVWGPASSYIEDNNALAVAVLMVIPLLRYLQLTSPVKRVRYGLTALMLLCAVGAIGSHSRGAFLALVVALVFFFWKTKRKAQVLLVGALALPVAISLMPENWHNRMDTIANYEQDSSAMSRLNAWATMTNIAVDRPLVGGGFEAATGWVYGLYSPDKTSLPQVAHSIYFQALGEHGFVGLALYLWLYYMFWRHAKALIRMTSGRAELAWAHHLGLMMQVTLVTFAVGGAFLSLVMYDVPYYLLMILAAVRVLVERELKANSTPPFKSTPQPWHHVPQASSRSARAG